RDDAVEKGAVIKAAGGQIDEVLDVLGGLVVKELDRDVARVRLESRQGIGIVAYRHLFVLSGRLGGGSEEEGDANRAGEREGECGFSQRDLLFQRIRATITRAFLLNSAASARRCRREDRICEMEPNSADRAPKRETEFTKGLRADVAIVGAG